MTKRYTKAEIQRLAEDLIEDLRECEDGTATSTSRLTKEYGYDDMDEVELFDLHAALFCAAKKYRIILDMSEHDGKLEGLLYNLEFVVKNKNARIKCPYCGSVDTAKYIYGNPAFSERMQRKLDEGKWRLGGCCIRYAEVNGKHIQSMPTRFCNKCNKDFASAPLLITPKRNLAEDYREIVKSIRLSVGGFFDGMTEITITKNNNGAVVKVMKYPYRTETPEDRQITAEKWNEILNALYSQMYLHEWKKSFIDPLALDGTQWYLDIKLTGRRARHYHGSNAYPPYWKELKKVFRGLIP